MTLNSKFKTSLLASAITFALTACGGGGGGNGGGNDLPNNAAPTDIELSSEVVVENEAGAVVGTLSATDTDSTSFTYSVDNDQFAVSGSQLKLADDFTASFADDAGLSVTVTVNDNEGGTYNEEFYIAVEVVSPTNEAGELVYEFESKFNSGVSSVSYTGQIARHAYIKDLFNFIGNINDGEYTTKDEVLAALNVYFLNESDVAADLPITFTTTPATEQATVGEISSGKTLVGKVAGNDASGQHKDWNNDVTAFVGWGEAGEFTPTTLVDHYFDLIAEQVIAGGTTTDPDGNTFSSNFVNADGLDSKQLVQKYLLGAVVFSQAADDYLDRRFEDDNKGATKGLNAANDQDGTKAYTKLEHQIDEGFGYFGAAVNYASYTDEEIAGKGGRDGWSKGYNDIDTDGDIDLTSEYNWGNSTNAAKRDLGATVETDLTGDAFTAFVKLRAMANSMADNAGTELTDEQKTAMEVQAQAALLAWEKSISATVVHYINDSINDYDTIIENGGYVVNQSADGSLSILAKHWAEMKGFALGLQFNPSSPLTDEQFAEVHALFRDKPELNSENFEAYKADLIAARTILQEAYDFAQENVENW
ncbi:DUF4856 domain-containing protein [Catenovulum sp. SM1970]|uniref:DUF4856 domain-containing protein n=1 Tax=Marinifaba aquimaris TaxID=2741323 RepID=UPI001571B369|nr:DUF4856 domain-containing protein [Marinifaba aquimaris]NTS76999.1 DUF4856 domain-containing protein [Marinifaba aquimaris]